MTVREEDARTFLESLEPGSVDAVITSPPFSGLPGRTPDTLRLVAEVLEAAWIATDHVRGSVTIVVGSAPGNLLLPFQVAGLIEQSDFTFHSAYVWDRTGTLTRNIGSQVVTHDHVLHAVRDGHVGGGLLPTSVVRTTHAGFDYGLGVTTPPDLAAMLVNAASTEGGLVVDPFAGLAEIGVQALHQGRAFLGSDTSTACVEIANERLAAVPRP